MKRIPLRCLVTLICSLVSIHLRAQNFAAETRIDLDPGQFNLESLTPYAPSQTGFGQVFAGGSGSSVTIIVRQWDNGSVTVATPSRTQTYDQQTGQSSGTETGWGATFTLAGSEASGSTSSSVTQQTATTSNISNSLTFRVEGDLLIAVVEFTEHGVKYKQEISLGTVTNEGGFKAFASGFLEGKSVISGITGWNISDSNPPGKDAATGARGVKKSTGTAVYADVLIGYWVTVGRVNGVVVGCTVDPVYRREFID